MSYSIEKLPDDPIIITTMFEDFSMDQSEPFLDELIDLFDSLVEPVYLIADVDRYTFSVQDMLVALNVAVQGSRAIMHHPNLAGTVVVTSSKMMKLASKGAKSDAFGNIQTEVFETLEEALDHIRSRLYT